MTEAEQQHTDTIDEAAQKLSAALRRLSIAKKVTAQAEAEETAARREMLSLLDGEGLSHWSDTEGQATIRTRQSTAPVIPEMLRREVGEELANHYLEMRVNERKLFQDMPVLKEKLQRVVSETRYVTFTGVGEKEDAS